MKINPAYGDTDPDGHWDFMTDPAQRAKLVEIFFFFNFNRPGVARLYKKILNLEGHQNRITDSRVTANLLNGCIFPIGLTGEASQWEVC